jgi:enamine deaminase RidA (YjgF/YER057c/UK114 family)
MPYKRGLARRFGKGFLMTVTGLWSATAGAQSCKVNPATLAYSPGYAQLVVAPDGRTVYVAGQVAQDSTGALLGTSDDAQVRGVFGNLERALAVVGASWGDVLHWNIYVTSPSVVPVFRAVRLERLGTTPPPAATLVEVRGLARPDWTIEVEAVVSAPKRLTCAALRRTERPTPP